MNKADKKAYNKAYYQAHREDIKAYKKAWDQAHREDIKAYNRAHKDERKAWEQAHKDERKAYQKAWDQAHREELKDYHRSYRKSDTNSLGQTKHNIRCMSNQYLFNVLKHTKLDGYEIHHCFGYDDYRNFIYIPKALHLQIHQYLRDNNIDADTDHYNNIVHLIIACEEYVYIKA